VACDKGSGGQIEDHAAIHLLVESKVEVVEGLLEVAELGLLFPPLQQALATQGAGRPLPAIGERLDLPGSFAAWDFPDFGVDPQMPAGDCDGGCERRFIIE
jgi:hypothetical protein